MSLKKGFFMCRDWSKFELDELTHLWMRYKEKTPPTMLSQHVHSKFELSVEEIEELVDHLLKKIWNAKSRLDGKSY